MAWSNFTTLAAVELAIYTPFIPVLLYTGYKHRLPGILGHLYVFAFVVIRVVTDALIISKRNGSAGLSTTAAVLNTVGLPPLLLAAVAIQNEARSYIRQPNQTKQDLVKRIGIEISMQTIVVIGVLLQVIGSFDAAAATNLSQVDNAITLAQAGTVLLLLSWIVSCAWVLINIHSCVRNRIRGSPRALLLAVAVALPFVGARTIYAILYTFDRSGNLHPVNASFAVRLCLMFLMQVVASASFLVGLVLSTDLRKTPCHAILGDAQTEVQPIAPRQNWSKLLFSRKTELERPKRQRDPRDWKEAIVRINN